MKFNFQLKFDSLFEFSAPAYNDDQISSLLTEAQFRVFITKYNPLGNKYKKGFEYDEQRRRDLDQLIKPALLAGYNNAEYLATFNTSGTTTIVIADIVDLFVPSMQIVGTVGKIGILNTIESVVLDNDPITPTTTITLTNPTTDGETTDTFKIVSSISSSQLGVHPDGVFFDLPEGFLYTIEEAIGLKEGVVAIPKETWVIPVKHDEYLANINNPYKKPYKDLAWRMDISRQVSGEDATPQRSEIITDGIYDINYYRMRYLSVPPNIVVDEIDPDNQVHCILNKTLHRDIVSEAVVMAQAASQKEAYQVGVAEKNRAE